MNTVTKSVPNCKAKDPAQCVYHGIKFNVYRPEKLITATNFDEYERQADALKHERLLHQTIHDIERSWKLKEYKDGTTTVTVFRSGIPEAPAQRGIEKESFSIADENKPEGMQGRMDAVFAAPTLLGVSRWVRGNYEIIDDLKVRQIEVDIDATYVYSVKEWEVSSSNYKYWGKQEEGSSHYQRTDYWKTGMTMREYMKRMQENPEEYNPTEWELLIPPAGAKSIKAVSGNRVADTVMDSSNRTTVRGILSGKKPHTWKQEHNEI